MKIQYPFLYFFYLFLCFSVNGQLNNTPVVFQDIGSLPITTLPTGTPDIEAQLERVEFVIEDIFFHDNFGQRVNCSECKVRTSQALTLNVVYSVRWTHNNLFKDITNNRMGSIDGYGAKELEADISYNYQFSYGPSAGRQFLRSGSKTEYNCLSGVRMSYRTETVTQELDWNTHVKPLIKDTVLVIDKLLNSLNLNITVTNVGINFNAHRNEYIRRQANLVRNNLMKEADKLYEREMFEEAALKYEELMNKYFQELSGDEKRKIQNRTKPKVDKDESNEQNKKNDDVHNVSNENVQKETSNNKGPKDLYSHEVKHEPTASKEEYTVNFLDGKTREQYFSDLETSINNSRRQIMSDVVNLASYFANEIDRDKKRKAIKKEIQNKAIKEKNKAFSEINKRILKAVSLVDKESKNGYIKEIEFYKCQYKYFERLYNQAMNRARYQVGFTTVRPVLEYGCECEVQINELSNDYFMATRNHRAFFESAKNSHYLSYLDGVNYSTKAVSQIDKLSSKEFNKKLYYACLYSGGKKEYVEYAVKRSNDKELISWLRQKGWLSKSHLIEIYKTNPQKYLLKSIEDGDKAMVTLLLNIGAKANHTSKRTIQEQQYYNGTGSADQGCSNGIELINILVYNSSPLATAMLVDSVDMEIVSELIRNGANPNDVAFEWNIYQYDKRGELIPSKVEPQYLLPLLEEFSSEHDNWETKILIKDIGHTINYDKFPLFPKRIEEVKPSTYTYVKGGFINKEHCYSEIPWIYFKDVLVKKENLRAHFSPKDWYLAKQYMDWDWYRNRNHFVLEYKSELAKEYFKNRNLKDTINDDSLFLSLLKNLEGPKAVYMIKNGLFSVKAYEQSNDTSLLSIMYNSYNVDTLGRFDDLMAVEFDLIRNVLFENNANCNNLALFKALIFNTTNGFNWWVPAFIESFAQRGMNVYDLTNSTDLLDDGFENIGYDYKKHLEGVEIRLIKKWQKKHPPSSFD